MLRTLNSPISARAKPNATSHFGRSLKNAAGTRTPAIRRPNGTENPTPPKRKSEVIQRPQDGRILRDPGIRHHPENECSCHHVECGHQSSKQCNVGAGCAHTEKLKPAHHRGREDSKRNRGAELEEGADQYRLGISLKVSRDRFSRFPRPGKVRPARKADHLIQARVKEKGVNDCQEAWMRSLMVVCDDVRCFHE